MPDSKEFALEAEIAQLNSEIEKKRQELERSRGIVEEREIVKEVVSDHVYQKPTFSPPPQQTVSSQTSDQTSTNYLSTLDKESVEKVNQLIEMVGTDGLKKAIASAKNYDPFILDAFHDALVDKLYGELKSHGYIK